jgi:hypothetical protein
MPYIEFPAREYETGIIGGRANSAVTEYTFAMIAANGDITTATSGFAGIVVETAADNVLTSIKLDGIFRLKVNGNSVNIAAGDPLKPTTGGLGVKAATDKDQYSAIALEAATTDATWIAVVLAHGFVSAT